MSQSEADRNGRIVVLPTLGVRFEKMRDSIVRCWEDAIENFEIRGKLKRAVRVFAEKEARDLLESLEDAPEAVWRHWEEFTETWVVSEVQRVCSELSDAYIRKAAWEGRRDHARGEKLRRMHILQADVEQHVRSRGGAIDYAPAFVALSLKKSRQTLKPARVDRAMRNMVRAGVAKTIVVGKNSPVRFVLLN